MNTRANQMPVGLGVNAWAHLAGFGSGLLALFGVLIGTVLTLWAGHYLGLGPEAGQWIAGSGMLGAIVALYRTWKNVATEVRSRHSPGGLAARQAEEARAAKMLSQIEAGALPNRYCFYDDGGNVILETDQCAAVQQALVAGTITRQTKCEPTPSSASNKKPPRLPLVDSKLAEWPALADYLCPLSNPRLLGGACGCTLGLLVFLAVWIGATLQGNFAQLTWPAYLVLLAVLAVVAMSATAVLGLVVGDAIGLKRLRTWGFPVDRCGETPFSERAITAMILSAGFVLGGLLMLAGVPL